MKDIERKTISEIKMCRMIEEVGMVARFVYKRRRCKNNFSSLFLCSHISGDSVVLRSVSYHVVLSFVLVFAVGTVHLFDDFPAAVRWRVRVVAIVFIRHDCCGGGFHCRPQ